MLTILIFFVILLVLVLIHEAGHFIVAKLSGMRVDEFAFGFPPKLFGFKKGETEYNFNALPLGGYVKIFGENGDEDPNTDLSRAFSRQPKYKQILVLLAGVFMNIVLAFVLFIVVFTMGTQVRGNDFIDSSLLQNKKVVVSSVSSGSPAEKAGLKPLDEIKSISSESGSLLDISAENIPIFISDNQDSTIRIKYIRADTTNTVDLIPAAGIVEGKKIVGITAGEVGLLKLPLFKAVQKSAVITYEFTKLTFIGFYDLIHKIILGQGKVATASLTGPVGIVGLVGDARSEGLAALLGFTALISINLAVLNILPFPALDGGRIVFVLIEAIRRKPISFKTQNIVNGVSFALLLLLMIVVTGRDVLKLII